jgi:signal transduction histidine kinase
MKGVEIIYLNNWGGDDMFSDPNRLKQILMNLLSNALKFTSNGKITVLVEEPTSREKFNLNNQGIMKNIIRVTVSDTGAGIPDEIKPKLFNMYATFDHNNGI